MTLQGGAKDEKKGFQKVQNQKEQKGLLGKGRRKRNRALSRRHLPGLHGTAYRNGNSDTSFLGVSIMETMTLKKAVLTVFDSLPVGSEFYANELRAKAAELFPEAGRKYENSILMVIRRHRREFYHYADRAGKLVKIGE